MPYLTNLLPLAAGALFCFGHPSFIAEKGLPIFPILGLSLFFLTIGLKNKKRDLINVFLFGAAINIIAFYWIPQTITTFGRIPYPISFVLFLLFSFLVIPFTWISYIICYNGNKFNWIKKIQKNPELVFLLLSFVLTLVEYFTPSQFPIRVGQAWMNFPEILGLAPLFGLPIYSFVTYQLSLNLFSTFRFKKIQKLNLIISFLILISGILLKPVTFQKKTLAKEDTNFNVRIVQANIGNYMKIQSELGQFNSIQEVYNRYFSQSVATTKLDLDLIVWPETSFPQDLNTDRLELNPSSLPPIFKNIISNMQSEMLIGGYDTGKLSNSVNNLQTVYNSAFHFSDNGKYLNVYHKHQLIPFGETLPFGPLTPYLKDYIPGVSFFSRDDKHIIFETRDQFRFIVPICYELLSSQHIRDALNKGTKNQKHPHFIINLTNDSWYGKTAEPYQHLFLAKWRALEFQIPVIRSTNSGITSIFDVDGEESSRLFLGEVKPLDLSIKLVDRVPTLFQKFGILSLGLVFLMLFTIIGLITKLNNRES